MTPNRDVWVKQVVTCEHKDTDVYYGDDISTTGPTGIYEKCRKCGKQELIGHSGRHGDVLYGSVEYQERLARRRELQRQMDALSD